LSRENLIYSPLRDIEAVAPNGKLKTPKKDAMKITFTEDAGNIASILIRKGKNRNIATEIIGRSLGERLQSIEQPYSIIVPGLAGIPPFEEYRPPSVIRKAAAKGDSNSVFRNILLLLSEDNESWIAFEDKLSEMFPSYKVSVKFDKNTDEHLDAKVLHDGMQLPIDSCGTGVLQAIQILAYYYLYRPQLLVLDEPDAHLHPDNQRKIANIIKDLSETEDCQVIISTHSRHFLNAIEDQAKIHWIRNSSLVSNEDPLTRNILFELGALDKGDLLQNGGVKCVILTEDSDTDYVETLFEASGFRLDETEVWSYQGCSNVGTALALYAFITKYAPATQVVLHRDRDYMTDEEVNNYQNKFGASGLVVFVTEGNDVEWYYVNSQHVTALYPHVSVERAEELIAQSIQERREAILEKYINTVHKRILQASYRGGNKPNAGKISNECGRLIEQDPQKYFHGKIVSKSLRTKIQQEIGGDIDLCQASDFLGQERLQVIAQEIWK
jgi:hypothetical protein